MKDSFKVVFLAGIGAILEVYDFLLYVIFSHQIVAAFFTNIESETAKGFIAIAIFSLTYLVRPFGAITLGIIGDIYGRKKFFTFTILLMGLSSLAMGLMPSYASIGITASVCLIIFRLCSRFCIKWRASSSICNSL